MKIELKEILIKDLINGYKDDGENGVIGFDGKLNIRPPYQREFVYKTSQMEEVIKSIMNSFPLNSIYWVKNGEDTFEVLDGQQRILSICKFCCDNLFLYKGRRFDGLTETERNKILNYKLLVYICEGNDDIEKLEWFRIINIAGEKLTEQELRNAIYTGTWLYDAKKYFSRNNCASYNLGKNFLNGSPIRQDYLETVLKWISNNKIEEYMGCHQNNKDANELWQYFQDVINWINKLFLKYRKEMKGIEWGSLYNKYKDKTYNTNDLEKQITELYKDDEVQNKKGIFLYVLTNENKHLNLRTFTENQKNEYFENHKNKNDLCICAKCGKEITLKECQADHIKPWSKGGKTTIDNLQFLCQKCNARKSNHY